MGFTKAQAKKVEQIKEIAKLGRVDFWNVENEPDNKVRNVLLEICNDRLVRACIVAHYVLVDELLSYPICQHFFGRKKTSIELWRTKRVQNFNYYVIEELSLFKKLALVKAFMHVPKPVAETIRSLNNLRNAVAHSFFPTTKRDFRRAKKVTHKGKDVFTVEGMTVLNADHHKAVGYLWPLVFGKRRSYRHKAGANGDRKR